MLEKITHIEGLDAHEDFDLFDDVHPDGLIVKFFVVSEEMPFLTEKAGKVVRQNFVHVRVEKHLGQTVFQKRVNDTLEFNETTGKWTIKKLYPGSHGNWPHSHIKRWPDAWNRFMNGLNEVIVGTPLSLLFKADPSRVAYYKTYGIESIESLANQNPDGEGLVSGARADIAKAKAYLAKVEAQAPALELQGKFAEKDRQLADQARQIADLTAKLTEILEEQHKPKNKGGRPRKEVIEESVQE